MGSEEDGAGLLGLFDTRPQRPSRSRVQSCKAYNINSTSIMARGCKTSPES
jgi:hypothetical protein